MIKYYSRFTTKFSRQFKDHVEVKHLRKMLATNVKEYKKYTKEYGDGSVISHYMRGTVLGTITGLQSVTNVLYEQKLMNK